MRRAIAILILVALATIPLAPMTDAQQDKVVYQVEIDDIVTRGTVLDVEAAVAKAEEASRPLIVRLETPGGLVAAEQEITQLLLNAEVPVITYVGPRGASAFSAGTYILLAGHQATMNDGTSMGSAMPVVSGPAGGSQAASNKTINALASHMRSIAESRGRPQALAVDMVRNNTDYTASQALDVELVNATGGTRAGVLEAIDGRTVDVQGEEWTLDVDGAQVVIVDGGLTSQLYRTIGNPQIAFLMMIIGMYGLIFGFAAGGTYVPETIGAVLLLLGLFGLGLFDFSTAALLLIGLAVIFFVAEALTPTHGILTTAGVVSLAVGALLLPSQEPLLGAEWIAGFQLVVVGMAVVTGLFFFGIVVIGVRSLLRTEEHEPVKQRRGTVLAPMEEGRKGRIRVRGEIWQAELVEGAEPVGRGDPVVVEDREGLTLMVRGAVGPPGEEE